jgi:subtilisin family serine protease
MQKLSHVLIFVFFAGCMTARTADRFVYLGTGTIGDCSMLSSGFGLSAPKWAGNSVFNRPQSFTPNDPLYSSQWHLTAANVQAAWDQGFSGAGVTIGIVDDGVQVSHPDLNVSVSDSYDFVDLDSDPSPVLAAENHGTAVAGVAAATGNNNIGVASPAYNATVAGLRVGLHGNGTYQQFIDATGYRSSNTDPAQNSIKIKNHSYGIAAPYIDDAGIQAEVSSVNQSADAGTVHVIAAGNEGIYNEWGLRDANKKRFQANENAIVVSATDDNGSLAYYSNIGANVTVTAPSSGGTAGITTTDRTGADGYADGDTTSSFGGTSASAPLVAGIMALGAEANPGIDTRIAKHLLAKTSTQIDAESTTWNRNAAGINFSPYYGFGMINAGTFVGSAGVYTAATERVSGIYDWNLGTGTNIVDRPNDGTWAWGLIAGATISDTFFSDPLEEVILTVSMEAAEASYWTPTELTIDVLDPYGNQLTAAYYSTSTATVSSLIEWNYVLNGFWGQDPAGQWLVGVGDGVDNEQTGNLTALSMTFNTGNVIPEPSTLLVTLLVCSIAFWIRRRFYD